MPFHPGLFAALRRPRREASRPKHLWNKHLYTGPGLASGVVRRRGSRDAIEMSARFGNRQPCSINSRSLSSPTSGRLTSSISGPSTSPTGVSNRIWRHCWGISDFPGGYGGVVSGQVESRVSAVENRQSVEFVEILALCHLDFRPQPWFLTRIYILPTGRFLENVVFLAITVFAQRHQRMFVADGRTDGFATATMPC